MITFKTFLTEFVRKGTWEHLLTKDKSEYSSDLIHLVDRAYKHTTLGSFVKTVSDVKNSEWVVLDYNDNPNLDIVIFYRGPRANETWKGKKIQGVGHDGDMVSKMKMMEQLNKLLKQDGWWIEASDRMEGALRKSGAPVLKKNQEKVLPGIKDIHDNGSYTRVIDGVAHTETIFGKPIV